MSNHDTFQKDYTKKIRLKEELSIVKIHCPGANSIGLILIPLGEAMIPNKEITDDPETHIIN